MRMRGRDLFQCDGLLLQRSNTKFSAGEEVGGPDYCLQMAICAPLLFHVFSLNFAAFSLQIRLQRRHAGAHVAKAGLLFYRSAAV